jgi:hypothetical protein
LDRGSFSPLSPCSLVSFSLKYAVIFYTFISVEYLGVGTADAQRELNTD